MADIPKEVTAIRKTAYATTVSPVMSQLDDAPYRNDGPLSNCLWALFCVFFVSITKGCTTKR